MELGKCPKCDAVLTKEEVEVIRLHRTTMGSHFVYKCKLCDYIIGFSSMYRG